MFACTPSESTGEDTANSAVTGAAPITSGLTGKCLDDNKDATSNGNKIQLYTCNGTAAQKWTHVNHTFVGPGGKCLDINTDHQVVGNVVQLYQCNGTAAQDWAVDGDTIRSTNGLCLDVRGDIDANGTQVQLNTCNGGTGQVWNVAGSGSGPMIDAGVKSGSGTSTIKSPVFLDGKFDWAGDWNAVAFNYDQAGAGVAGPGPVIGMPGSQAYEYWLPYPPSNFAGPASNGVNFDLTGLTSFTIAIKPSEAGALASMGFYRATGGTDDIPYGNSVTISQGKYGPATMTAGQWNVYTIPLADFAVSGWIYKFIIQQQGVTPQSWEIDQVGFN